MVFSKFQRRDVLKTGAMLAAGLVVPKKTLFSADEGHNSWSFPPEVATIYSKDYGRKRIKKVQAALKKAGLEGLVVTNRGLDYIGYVSNFHPFPLEPGLALIPAEGPTTLFVNTYSSAHTRALKPLVWCDQLVDVPRDHISEGSNRNLIDWSIRSLLELKLDKSKIGLAGDEVDWILPYYFRQKLPSARFEDANRTLTEVIAIKDEVEIALIRFAQRYIDEIAYPTFTRNLKPGALDYDVFTKVLAAMLERGSSPGTVLLWDAGPAGAGTWASSTRGRTLEKSDIVLSEPTPSIAGYQSEKMYTFALGRDVPESQKKGAHVVFEAFELLMEDLKPGRKLSTIVEKVNSYFRSKGYEGATVPVGHWIGTQNHEGPRFTAEGTRDWVLQTNMVMSWHPNLVIPGKVRTTCSTCVLITDKGAQDLSSVKMEPIYYL